MVGLLGIEPSLPAPKAGVLPVYDSPKIIFNLNDYYIFGAVCKIVAIICLGKTNCGIIRVCPVVKIRLGFTNRIAISGISQ